MIATLLAVLDPGDEVVVFEPFYENYGPDAILSGAVPRFVQAAAARLDASIPTSWRRAFCPQHAGDHREHARTTRRARSSRATELAHDRRPLPGARRAGHHRRDLRAHPLRRRRAHPDGDPARHGRAHDHHQRHEQDLQRHGLARGLGDRSARAHRRHPQGARLPDRGGGGAACRRRARWPSPCPTRTTPTLAAVYARRRDRLSRHPRSAPASRLPRRAAPTT